MENNNMDITSAMENLNIVDAIEVNPVPDAVQCRHALFQATLEERVNQSLTYVAPYIREKHPELIESFSAKVVEEEAKNADFYEVMEGLVRYYNKNEEEKALSHDFETSIQKIRKFFTLKAYNQEVVDVISYIKEKIDNNEFDEDGTIVIEFDSTSITHTDSIMCQVEKLLNQQGNSLYLIEVGSGPHDIIVKLMDEFDRLFPGHMIKRSEDITWVDVNLKLNNVRHLIFICLQFMDDTQRRSYKFGSLFRCARIWRGNLPTQLFFTLFFESSSDASTRTRDILLIDFISMIDIFNRSFILDDVFKQRFRSYIGFYEGIEHYDIYGSARKRNEIFGEKTHEEIVADINHFFNILKSNPTWTAREGALDPARKDKYTDMDLISGRGEGLSLEKHSQRDFDKEEVEDRKKNEKADQDFIEKQKQLKSKQDDDDDDWDCSIS